MKISYKKILPFVLSTGMLSGCGTYIDADGLARYVVTAKSDNKLEFRDVAIVSTRRTMTFNPADSLYYRNIHVGDTIGCARTFTDSELVVPVDSAQIKLIIRADILKLLEQQQRQERLDSLMRIIKANQERQK